MPLKDFEKEFPVAVKCLRNAIANNRIAHAYLLHCDNEEIAENFSSALAQAILCPENSRIHDACGKCKTCIAVAKNSYPELFRIAPTSQSRKIPVGKDSGDINSIRWFQSLFDLRAAYGSEKKIGIIRDADCMMSQAQNAFLKTLEEPPSESFFIITTSNPLELLPTFRSRCQRLSLLRNSQEYKSAECKEIIGILQRMTEENNNLAVAEQLSLEMNAVFSTLRQKAENIVTERMSSEIKNAKSSDNKSSEKLDERIKAIIEAEYIKLTEELLSLIHAYFVRSYMAAVNIDQSYGPLQELNIKNTAADERTAFKRLLKTEDFLRTMKLNVKESLAIKAFCYSIIFSD